MQAKLNLEQSIGSWSIYELLPYNRLQKLSQNKTIETTTTSNPRTFDVPNPNQYLETTFTDSGEKIKENDNPRIRARENVNIIPAHSDKITNISSLAQRNVNRNKYSVKFDNKL